MTDLRGRTGELYTLERLSAGETCIHRLHPLAKLLSTLVFLVCVASLNRYAFSRLAPFCFYPILLSGLADIPLSLVLRRTLPALPFCLFAGLSNLVLEREVLLHLGPLPVSWGAASLCTLLVRTVLCVSAVLLLVGATPFVALTGQLRRMHLPGFFLSLFEMTYRYLGALLEEADSMYTAYRLRSRGIKGLALRHVGSFVGQLLLRSFDRAERIYQAMRCRGFALRDPRRDRRRLVGRDWLFLFFSCGSSLLFRMVDVPLLLGGLFSCWN